MKYFFKIYSTDSDLDSSNKKASNVDNIAFKNTSFSVIPKQSK